MNIRFVNHASFILEEGPVRLISDPWLEGTAFDQGWELLAQTQLKYEDFASITHIWFSHEHPDHFHPQSLRKIPEQYRKNITVLFKESEDGKVVDWCRQHGFGQVIELKRKQWVRLADDIQIMNSPFGVDDSWLCIKTPDGVILNINDCEVHTQKQAESIKAIVGDVDVLCTQFSYAGWAGNKDEPHLRKERARQKLDWVKTQTDVFRPKYVIPFASFVWFCHEENYYMNDGVNRIGDVARFIAENTAAEPVILYPTETWRIGEAHDSAASIAKWEQDHQRMETSPTLIRSNPVEPAVLMRDGAEYIQKVRRTNNPLMLKALLKPVTFFVTDYNRALRMSLDGGITEANLPYDQCDVAMTSDSLDYCFKHLWGWNTLRINGRLQAPRGNQAQFKRFATVGNLSALNNAGVHMGFNPTFVGFALKHASQAVLNRLG